MTRALLSPTLDLYPGLSLVRAGETARITPRSASAAGARFLLEVPEDYAYLVPFAEHRDWVAVDASGTVTLSPPEDSLSGIVYLPVSVVHGQDSADAALAFVNVQVVAADEEGVNPALPAVSFGGCVRVTVGRSRALTPMMWDRRTGDILPAAPEGYSFSIRGAGRRNARWVEVSPAGAVQAAPPAGTRAGTYHVPVTVTQEATGATTAALVHIEVA